MKLETILPPCPEHWLTVPEKFQYFSVPQELSQIWLKCNSSKLLITLLKITKNKLLFKSHKPPKPRSPTPNPQFSNFCEGLDEPLISRYSLHSRRHKYSNTIFSRIHQAFNFYIKFMKFKKILKLDPSKEFGQFEISQVSSPIKK